MDTTRRSFAGWGTSWQKVVVKVSSDNGRDVGLDGSSPGRAFGQGQDAGNLTDGVTVMPSANDFPKHS